MTKDFLIVSPKTLKTKNVNKILDSLMETKKIKISSSNYVIIGNKEKIIFDVSDHIIRGRILKDVTDKEINILKRLVSSMGKQKIYMHYYDKDEILKGENIISI